MRIRRYHRQRVIKEIQGIIRTFPSKFVSIERTAFEQIPETGEQIKIYVTLWQGEALVRQVTSTVQRLELGHIITGTIAILVPGQHDFREKDFVRMRKAPKWALNHPQPVTEVLYQVQRTADVLGAFALLELNVYQQQPAP